MEVEGEIVNRAEIRKQLRQKMRIFCGYITHYFGVEALKLNPETIFLAKINTDTDGNRILSVDNNITVV